LINSNTQNQGNQAIFVNLKLGLKRSFPIMAKTLYVCKMCIA